MKQITQAPPEGKRKKRRGRTAARGEGYWPAMLLVARRRVWSDFALDLVPDGLSPFREALEVAITKRVGLVPAYICDGTHFFVIASGQFA